MPVYKRIILRLSGETLSGAQGTCYEEARIMETAAVILKIAVGGTQVGVVMGGGNIWRGRLSKEMDAVNADQMGMLATIMNAIAVQDAIIRLGGKATVFSAQEMTRFARLYTREDALNCLNSGGIALLSGGSGNPFFTTDTAAALRAAELKADAVLKGTTAEGVMDDDPRVNPNARLVPDATYDEVISKSLKVMDTAAFLICKEQKVPVIHVFSMEKLENIIRVTQGEIIGSVVHL